MKLLVIVPDRISDILTKGEYQPLYYNPGEVADEVHILLLNDDRPDPETLRPTVGNARLVLHNYPDDLTLPPRRFAFLAPWRLRRWAKAGVDLIRSISPDLIRCHGADWNAYLASRARQKLGIPYCISLHTNPDTALVRRVPCPTTPEQRRHNFFYEYLEREALCNADRVLPVYKSILPYLKRLEVCDRRIEVCYNVLNRMHLQEKADYQLHSPVQIIYVSRLLEKKNPNNIIHAVAALPDACLTIVGDGPIRGELEALARELGASDRIAFEPAVQNDELCRRLPEFDIFAVHTEYWEISKSVLEALLTGLPVVINRRHGEAVPELEGDFVRMVPNTTEAYLEALADLMADHAGREALGRRAFAHARANWDPRLTESKYVDIYRTLLSEAHRG